MEELISKLKLSFFKFTLKPSKMKNMVGFLSNKKKVEDNSQFDSCAGVSPRTSSYQQEESAPPQEEQGG